MDLETLISQQNPQWIDPSYQKPEKNWPERLYLKKTLAWLNKRPVVALTGLRRSGKSTILKQIKYSLEEKIDPRQILYFSFEKSQVKFHPDVLRSIVNWYLASFLKITPANIKYPVYLFLDEIQYIPFWQDIVKTFYDSSPNLKFFLSGSSSLFIKKKSLESLAGRMVEIIIPALHFQEYCRIKNILQEKPLLQLFPFQKQIVNSYFEEYLTFGQFPEPVKDDYTKEQTRVYLSSIEEKIIEQDLPKLYRIERVDILRLIFEFLKTHTGQIIEYKNITNDLGIDLKTTRKYFEYLSNSFLICFCLNWTKKKVKSARTGKKIYLSSGNFSESEIGLLAENYIFNYFSLNGKVFFFRKGNFEVDFIAETSGKLLPVEVKYRENIENKDFKNLVKLAGKLKSDKALLISKNLFGEELIDGVKLQILPASLLEEAIV